MKWNLNYQRDEEKPSAFFLKKKLRFVFEDEGWREKKVDEGLVDDSKESSQYLIDLFFTLIDFDGI